MMENKYYTPNIEDLRIGYVYEYLTNGDDWIRHTIHTSADLIECIEDLELKWLRTPYLTKEQIENEGWAKIEAPIITFSNDFLDIPFTKINDHQNMKYRLDYNIKFNLLHINRDQYSIFYGNCPSINEFRTIMKLLDIK